MLYNLDKDFPQTWTHFDNFYGRQVFGNQWLTDFTSTNFCIQISSIFSVLLSALHHSSLNTCIKTCMEEFNMYKISVKSNPELIHMLLDFLVSNMESYLKNWVSRVLCGTFPGLMVIWGITYLLDAHSSWTVSEKSVWCWGSISNNEQTSALAQSHKM